jgi:conjugative transfer signal peptidase TraF
MTRRGVIAAAVLGLAALGASVWARPDLHLTYNPSPSAARGWYRVVPLDRPLALGDRVLVWPPAWAGRLADRRRYVPASVPLLKRVAATGGARLCRAGGAVTIDGRVVATAKSADSAGRPMPVWHGCHRLRADELFLLAERADSFDGRYFGAVGRDRVIARVAPLWTW